MQLFCLQLEVSGLQLSFLAYSYVFFLVFLLTVGVFYLQLEIILLTVGAFLLTVGKRA